MKSPSQIVHQLAGSPKVEGCYDALVVCWLCGRPYDRRAWVMSWQGANSTDQNKCRCPGSNCICEACAWACSWVQPPGHPLPLPGKKGTNLRLWTHLWSEETGYHYLNKAQKPEILSWLRAPKNGRWFAAIADTGQKHTLPWTPINIGPEGSVFFEEFGEVIMGDWQLVDAMGELLNLGITKGEKKSCDICTGTYTINSWRWCADKIRAFEAVYGHLRGSGWFSLALWLAQRDEEKAKEAISGRKRRPKKGKRANRKAALRDQKNLSDNVPGKPGRAAKAE